ncbi:Hypothetical protein CpMEX30_0937 [Corynebacterium pseudotuberculosis]|nr:Hypothetical protein Cp106_0872 [Corynebacterium pseudotuberculosis 1/06-A]APG81461.1 Hypothetical protein CPI37_0786 [Corynebacterium pseudotuberculosis]APQ53990.1 Hypothetical protein CpMEX30_0937 [Corynebacterium pseudotuberculosis]APQ56081.1 Hypothetical protein CpMEX31_0941 [Corynebacterium pseudotuberculosis]ATB61836.1 Hypothetical protein BFF96_0951 [Corynebacterium pseudotuberculosis]
MLLPHPPIMSAHKSPISLGSPPKKQENSNRNKYLLFYAAAIAPDAALNVYNQPTR